MSIKIFISVGDPSADIHSANLMKSLKSKNSSLEFYGIGGNQMIAEGLHPILHLKEISVVGFWEVAKKYFFFKKLFQKCIDFIKENNIKFLILVDYPGFNIPLAKAGKSLGMKVIYYIVPQIWAWGKGRAKKLKDNVDKLLVVFPFEEEFYKKLGLEAVFVGHPILDNPKFSNVSNNKANREKIIAFLPGSRKQELARHLKLVEKSAFLLKKKLPDYSLIIGKAKDIERNFYYKSLSTNSEIELVEDSIDLMKKSYVGAIKTGTSNLEAIFCELPFVMFYKTSALSYFLGKNLINLQNISIANILTGKNLVTELIQSEATAEKIADSICELVRNEVKYSNMIEEFKRIKNELSKEGASEKASEEILNLILNET